MTHTVTQTQAPLADIQWPALHHAWNELAQGALGLDVFWPLPTLSLGLLSWEVGVTL